MSIYDVDPKKFARIERPKPAPKAAPAVVNVRNNILSLTTIETGYGLVSDKVNESLEGFIMTLFPTSSTNALMHQSLSKCVVVLDGSGTVELNKKNVPLVVGSLLVIPPNKEYRFFTSSDYLVLAVSQESKYEDGLIITNNFEVKGVLPGINHVGAPEVPRPRHKSKLTEQLLAEQNKRNSTNQGGPPVVPLASKLADDDTPFNPLDPDSY